MGSHSFQALVVISSMVLLVTCGGRASSSSDTAPTPVTTSPVASTATDNILRSLDVRLMILV